MEEECRVEDVSVMDVRCFGQDEMKLAADICELNTADALRDDLIIPTINPKFFNESVASKKQTYNRFYNAAPAAAADKANDSAGRKKKEDRILKMKGTWVSVKKRQKIVDAVGFPKGWKVSIGVRSKDGRSYFEFRDYRSPDGKSWSSFKEAAESVTSTLRETAVVQKLRVVTGADNTADGDADGVAGARCTSEVPKDEENNDDNNSGQVEEDLLQETSPQMDNSLFCIECNRSFNTQSQFWGHLSLHSSKRRKGNRKVQKTTSPLNSIKDVGTQTITVNNCDREIEMATEAKTSEAAEEEQQKKKSEDKMQNERETEINEGERGEGERGNKREREIEEEEGENKRVREMEIEGEGESKREIEGEVEGGNKREREIEEEKEDEGENKRVREMNEGIEEEEEGENKRENEGGKRGVSEMIGWKDDEGCNVCRKSVRWSSELVMCDWCEEEFHLTCCGVEVSMAEWTCSTCTPLTS